MKLEIDLVEEIKTGEIMSIQKLEDNGICRITIDKPLSTIEYLMNFIKEHIPQHDTTAEEQQFYEDLREQIQSVRDSFRNRE